MKILLQFLLSIIIVSSLDAKAFEAENAVSEMDSWDEISKKFFWDYYIMPEFSFVVNASVMGCDNAPITTDEAVSQCFC